MRNIKSTLRFARNSALLIAAVSGALYLTGCSNETDLTQTPDANEPTMGVGSYSVYTSNPNRVHNYGNGLTRAAGEGAAAESFEMKAVKDIPVPSDAEELKYEDNGYGGNKFEKYYGNFPTGHYVIPAGQEFITQFNPAEKVVFYVYGTLKLTSISVNHPTTIYVMDESAKLDLNGCTVMPDLTIFNYGTVCSSANGVLYLKGTLWSLTSLDFTDENSNCSKVHITPKSDVRCKGSIIAKEFEIEGDATACGIVSQSHIKMDYEGTFKTSYIEAKTVEMNQSTIELDDNGLVWAKEEFEATGAKSRVKVKGTNALLYTPSLKTRDINSLHINDNFEDQNVKVVYGEVNFDLSQATVKNLYAYNQVSEGKDAYGKAMGVAAAGCHGAFGPTGNPEDPFGELEEDPETDPEPTITLIPVADIENPDAEDELKHDHGDISATCISFNGNGVAFASFHRRGTESSDYNQDYTDNKGHKGCIEKIVYENGAFALKSFMIAPEWDFNHILADGTRVIAVGNHVNKGAFIGWLPASFEASTGVSNDFSYKELTTDEKIVSTASEPNKNDKYEQIAYYKNAGDGNCVVRVGDLYYVTTYRGYGALKADFTKAGKFTETSGSSKHIALDGNGKMAIISLDEKGVTSSPATIKEFATSDSDFASPSNEYKAGANVAPIDGKNTIAYSGSDLFACLGHGGLAKNGAKFYQRNNTPVNGVTVVGQYIFVANGSFLDVLDLQGNLLCHYHDKNLHSSNYVAVDENGYIYVAFGKSDIKIFRLGGTAVADNWYIAGK